jgi:hypothetical protein
LLEYREAQSRKAGRPSAFGDVRFEAKIEG